MSLLTWFGFSLDEIQNEIQNEKELSNELDAKLREWEKKIRQKQTEVGGANAAVTFNANVRKQERVLENRLDTVCGESSIALIVHCSFFLY
jgi:chromosome segregation ATPase